ncbi:MAG: hypothetical protein KAH32_02230 [Chlamydiia bacterium]|nr:hypothetical protein [Chlamydiia bacterium]
MLNKIFSWIKVKSLKVCNLFLGRNNITKKDVEILRSSLSDAFRNLKNTAGISERSKKDWTLKLQNLEDAVNCKDHKAADQMHSRILTFTNENNSSYFKAYAWFEYITPIALYCYFIMSFISISHVPSGSMRWTIQENDKVIVSMGDFNIRYAWLRKPAFFKEGILKRGSVTMWRDRSKQSFNALFSFVKHSYMQLVKRCVALPGDTVYFYGGKLYVVDKDGKFDSDFLKLQEDNAMFFAPILSKLPAVYRKSIDKNIISGEIVESYELFGKKLIEITHRRGLTYSIRNFQNVDINDSFGSWGASNYYEGKIIDALDSDIDEEAALEITYKSSIASGSSFVEPEIANEKSLIMLDSSTLSKMFNCIDTERFIVKNGVASCLSNNDGGKGFNNANSNFEDFKDVPNGVYEINNGQVFNIINIDPTCGLVPILSFSIKRKSHDTSLSSRSLANVKRLFNYGISINNKVSYTRRLLYISKGYLHIGRYKFLDINDLRMSDLLSKIDLSTVPYSNGKVDVDFIKKHGITIPDHKYMMLGDNTVSSSDSRFVGFIDQDDVEGRVVLIPSTMNYNRFALSSQPKVSLYVWAMRLIVVLHFLAVIALAFFIGRMRIKIFGRVDNDNLEIKNYEKK